MYCQLHTFINVLLIFNVQYFYKTMNYIYKTKFWNKTINNNNKPGQ